VKPIALYYEHPDWFRPLFATLERRGVPFVKLDAASHTFDPTESSSPYGLVFNRASPSAYLRGRGGVTNHALHFVRHLERIGVPVVNGSRVYELEISKAYQLELLARLGVRAPRSRVIGTAAAARVAAEGLRPPLLVKANVGGSGAGIVRFDSASAIGDAASRGELDLGPDGTALVQELAPLRGGSIARVELLGGKVLYGIRVFPPAEGSFNLCPADVCQTTGGESLVRSACALDAPKNGMRVEGFSPPPEIVEATERIAQAAGLDVGGIEYLVDDRDGEAYVYDINALSNFVADAPRVVGFDPFERLVDYLVLRLEQNDPLETRSVPREKGA
jgi:glutathione synthase/RimK-type ligase-like ATP-grasp enzyme